MKINELSAKHRTWKRWAGCIAAGLLTAALAACGGDSDTTAAAAPAAGGGTTTPATAAASITTATALAANDTATNPTASFAVVQDAGIAPVTIASPPKVNFTVASDGAVVKGLTASNVSVIIAKLVPGTNGAPDEWVSYTYRTETATATVGPGGKPVLASATQATTDAKQTDAALLAAQLAYNDAGYYTYTFSTDIKDTAKTNGVTFDASATHRVALQLSYTNKAGATVRVNPYFDFTIDASGNAVAVTDTSKSRKVVDITTCNECHSALALHGGGRVDTQYCVMCHNAGTTDANSGNVLDMTIMTHKIHAGKELKTLFSQDYAIWGYRNTQYDYNKVVFPQHLGNCTKCHDGSKKDASGNPLAAQGDNWKKVPSRAACGACHAGIDFAKNTGVTMADAAAKKTSSSIAHIGGAKTDDTQCVICHDATSIPVYHSDTTPTTADAAKRTMSATISKVVVDASGGATVTFGVTDAGVAVTDSTKFTKPSFGLVKLVEAAKGSSSYWVSYTARFRTKDAKKAPVLQSSNENAGTLTTNADGTFSYKFALPNGSTAGDIRTITHAHVASSVGPAADTTIGTWTWNAAAKTWTEASTTGGTGTGPNAVAYEPTLTHRVAMTFKKVGPPEVDNLTNAYYDFVPDGSAVKTTRNIVTMNTCASCHGGVKLHSGYATEYCVTCHNQSTLDPFTGDPVDFQRIIHKLHMGKNLPSVLAGGSYVINGTHDYSYGAFPGNIKDCAVCHSATATKPGTTTVLENAAAWYTTPTQRACGTCHDSTTTGKGLDHINSQISTTRELCTDCHGSTSTFGLDVKTVHSK